MVGTSPEIKIYSYVDDDDPWLEPIAFYYGYRMSTGIDSEGDCIFIADTIDLLLVLKYEEGGNRKSFELVS